MKLMKLPADPPRRVVPEVLNVAPDLVGQPLAPPLRRLYALAIDLGLVALLSELSDVWLALGLLAVVLMLRHDAGRLAGWRRVAGVLVVVVFVVLALRAGWLAWQAPRLQAERAGAAEKAAAVGAGLPDAERVALLESALRAAYVKRRETSFEDELERFVDALGVSFGWGVVYFSLVPALWRGQTVGKRVFGLRVVELTGRPITVLRALRRYGGYAAGMATGGLGFAQLLWDPNRQAIQDRAAHTVVLDLRAPAGS